MLHLFLIPSPLLAAGEVLVVASPPNVRCSPDCGLWRQDQAERRAMGAE